MRRHVDHHPPDVALLVDWGVGVNENVPSLLGIQIERARKLADLVSRGKLADRGVPHDNTRRGRAHHAMGVMPIDGVVVKPVDEIRRLFVVGDFSNGHRIAIAAFFTLFQIDGNTAVFYVADIAVVKRIEMGDVEKIFD